MTNELTFTWMFGRITKPIINIIYRPLLWWLDKRINYEE